MYQCLLVRKSALERIGRLDESLVSHQEWDTAIRLARHYPFGFLARPTFVYHRRAEGTVSGNKLNQARGYLQIVEKHKQAILSIVGCRPLARHYWWAAGLYRSAGDEPAARRCDRLSTLWRLLGRVAFRRPRPATGC
jgi:hypothetical protein